MAAAGNINIVYESLEAVAGELQTKSEGFFEIKKAIDDAGRQLEGVSGKSDGFLNGLLSNIENQGNETKNLQAEMEDVGGRVGNSATEFREAEANVGAEAENMGAGMESSAGGSAGGSMGKAPSTPSASSATPYKSNYSPTKTTPYTAPEIAPTTYNQTTKSPASLTSATPITKSSGTTGSTGTTGSSSTTATPSSLKSAVSGLGSTSATPAAALGAGLGAGLASNGFLGKGAGSATTEEEKKSFYGNNPMGNYKMSSDTWNSLSEETQEAVRNKLKDMGLSDKDIQRIINGEENVPQVAVEAISSSLQEAYANDPEIAAYLKEQYGFDIFNADGTVNDDRLALALLMDGGKSNDGLSLIDTLHNKYNIDLVDPMNLTNLGSRLSRVLEKDPALRELIKSTYGFDIFDENGLIDKDKLTLALLMDNKDPNDAFDLAKLLTDKYGQDEVMEELLKNVIRPDAGDVQQSGMGVGASVALGLGLTGAVGGGVAYAKKKQEEEKKEEESIFDEEDQKEEIEEEKKEWLSGLGLGILEEEKTEESSSVE